MRIFAFAHLSTDVNRTPMNRVFVLIQYHRSSKHLYVFEDFASNVFQFGDPCIES